MCGDRGKLLERFLIKDVKNSKLCLFFYTYREVGFALCLFVLKYLDSLIKPVNVKAKLINFYFWPFLSLCPFSGLVAADMNLGF